MSKKVFVLSDSLPLPRKEPELCRPEDTWPELLKPYFTSVYSVSVGGGTVTDLYEQLEYHLEREFDIAIVQLGIVDCAPRVMSREERIVLNYFWLSRKILLPVILKFKHIIRARRKLTYTGIGEFSRKLADIKRSFGKDCVLAIGILPAAEGYERMLPGITKNIERYNQVIKQVFEDKFIDVSDIPPEGIMSDFHHLTAHGHQFVSGRLLEKLASINQVYGNIVD